jgi:hypothetical protein
MKIEMTSSDMVACDDLIGREPRNDHYSKLITSDTDVYLDGILIISYRVQAGDALKLAATLSKKSKLTKGKRTNGLTVKNAIYGYLPRNPTRTNYCRPTGSSLNSRPMNEIGSLYAEQMQQLYREANPDRCEADMALVAPDVKVDWRIAGTMWSSLNVNVNHAIKYHRDSANWPGVYSNVFIYRQGCTGGDLVLPELGIAVKQRSGACIFFHGGKFIHGVSQIVETSPHPIRSSIVLYTMREMRNCSTPDDEYDVHAARMDEIALEKRLGNPKLRARYKSKIERLLAERGES